jgi:non-ribosomal peptide synthetase component E (peptide arylation enzyme)
MTAIDSTRASGPQPEAGRKGDRSHQRFPRFPDSYRERWLPAGLWADRTLHDRFDERTASRADDA